MEKNMGKNGEAKRGRGELLRRYGLLFVGLFIIALGVGITKRAALGISPLSSLANVLSCRFTVLSLGTWIFLWSALLTASQVVMLGRKFDKVQLLQIPLSWLFGLFTDLCTAMMGAVLPEGVYAVRILYVVLGTFVLALGTALTVIADVLMNAGEAFVNTLARVTGKEFGVVKRWADLSVVSLALLCSLIFFGWPPVGVREGTIISALLNGTFAGFWLKLLRSPVEKLLVKE